MNPHLTIRTTGLRKLSRFLPQKRTPAYFAGVLSVKLLKLHSADIIGVSMANYIDGFVFPISRDYLNEYKRLSEAVADIWKEHGALDYYEYVGDDMQLEGTRSFTDVVGTRQDEITVFGWVVFDSRETRELANDKVAIDPRMVELMSSMGSGFNVERMVYGGFQSLVQVSNGNAV